MRARPQAGRRRESYHRKVGHRQRHLRVRITEVVKFIGRKVHVLPSAN